ncbi:MAG: RidA family protein [Pirellulaceae bacterium]|nr:RidA family protein [Planctomycetales bacterium]
MSADERFLAHQSQLPAASKPLGLYIPALVVDNMAYLSGHGPVMPDGKLVTGRVGDVITQEQAYQAARQTALVMLASLRSAVGSLDRVDRLVKLLGMVYCTSDFLQQPAVINGCSEVMKEVFGEAHGVGARSAIGVAALPGGMSVEIEAIFRLKN